MKYSLFYTCLICVILDRTEGASLLLKTKPTSTITTTEKPLQKATSTLSKLLGLGAATITTTAKPLQKAKNSETPSLSKLLGVGATTTITTKHPLQKATSAPTSSSSKLLGLGTSTSTTTTVKPLQKATSAPTSSSSKLLGLGTSTSTTTTVKPQQKATSAPTSSSSKLLGLGTSTSTTTTLKPLQKATSAPTSSSSKLLELGTSTSTSTTSKPLQKATSAPTSPSSKLLELGTSTSTTTTPKPLQKATSAPTSSSSKLLGLGTTTTVTTPTPEAKIRLVTSDLLSIQSKLNELRKSDSLVAQEPAPSTTEVPHVILPVINVTNTSRRTSDNTIDPALSANADDCLKHLSPEPSYAGNVVQPVSHSDIEQKADASTSQIIGLPNDEKQKVETPLIPGDLNTTQTMSKSVRALDAEATPIIVTDTLTKIIKTILNFTNSPVPTDPVEKDPLLFDDGNERKKDEPSLPFILKEVLADQMNETTYPTEQPTNVEPSDSTMQVAEQPDLQKQDTDLIPENLLAIPVPPPLADAVLPAQIIALTGPILPEVESQIPLPVSLSTHPTVPPTNVESSYSAMVVVEHPDSQKQDTNSIPENLLAIPVTQNLADAVLPSQIVASTYPISQEVESPILLPLLLSTYPTMPPTNVDSLDSTIQVVEHSDLQKEDTNIIPENLLAIPVPSNLADAVLPAQIITSTDPILPEAESQIPLPVSLSTYPTVPPTSVESSYSAMVVVEHPDSQKQDTNSIPENLLAIPVTLNLTDAVLPAQIIASTDPTLPEEESAAPIAISPFTYPTVQATNFESSDSTMQVVQDPDLKKEDTNLFPENVLAIPVPSNLADAVLPAQIITSTDPILPEEVSAAPIAISPFTYPTVQATNFESSYSAMEVVQQSDLQKQDTNLIPENLLAIPVPPKIADVVLPSQIVASTYPISPEIESPILLPLPLSTYPTMPPTNVDSLDSTIQVVEHSDLQKEDTNIIPENLLAIPVPSNLADAVLPAQTITSTDPILPEVESQIPLPVSLSTYPTVPPTNVESSYSAMVVVEHPDSQKQDTNSIPENLLAIPVTLNLTDAVLPAQIIASTDPTLPEEESAAPIAISPFTYPTVQATNFESSDSTMQVVQDRDVQKEDTKLFHENLLTIPVPPNLADAVLPGQIVASTYPILPKQDSGAPIVISPFTYPTVQATNFESSYSAMEVVQQPDLQKQDANLIPENLLPISVPPNLADAVLPSQIVASADPILPEVETQIPLPVSLSTYPTVPPTNVESSYSAIDVVHLLAIPALGDLADASTYPILSNPSVDETERPYQTDTVPVAASPYKGDPLIDIHHNEINLMKIVIG